MRVLLASGLFYPDVGGPATHVRKIAERLSGSGHTVTVVSFGDHVDTPEGYKVLRVSRRMPRVISWMHYALRIFREAARHDVVYTFDLTTAGMPSALGAKLFGKPLVIRVGGDPIWEREVESGRRFLSLDEYYAQGLHTVDRPKLFFFLKMLLKTADRIVVYNDLFKNFYTKYFDVDAAKLRVLRNPLMPKEESQFEKDIRTFIFAGRFVAYKNLAFVIRATSRVVADNPSVRLLFIGDGPEKNALQELAMKCGVRLEIRPKADQKALFEAIRRSSVAIAPALSEFNPNFILESLSLGKPVLISKGHGLSVAVPAYMEFDSTSEDSLVQAMEKMLAEYDHAVRDVGSIPMDWTWDQVLSAHESLLHEIV